MAGDVGVLVGGVGVLAPSAESAAGARCCLLANGVDEELHVCHCLPVLLVDLLHQLSGPGNVLAGVGSVLTSGGVGVLACGVRNK